MAWPPLSMLNHAVRLSDAIQESSFTPPSIFFGEVVDRSPKLYAVKVQLMPAIPEDENTGQNEENRNTDWLPVATLRSGGDNGTAAALQIYIPLPAVGSVVKILSTDPSYCAPDTATVLPLCIWGEVGAEDAPPNFTDVDPNAGSYDDIAETFAIFCKNNSKSFRIKEDCSVEVGEATQVQLTNKHLYDWITQTLVPTLNSLVGVPIAAPFPALAALMPPPSSSLSKTLKSDAAS